MFFDGWFGLLRVMIVGVLAYASLVLFLRVSGKRTLSKMNAFDLIVTVSLGSTLATVLLSKDVALAEGMTAFALLIALQYVIAWLSTHSPRMEAWFKAEPALLCFEGRLLRDSMRRERVTEAEVIAAIRGHGVASVDEVGAVVLETDGTMTVLRIQDRRGYSALKNVVRAET